MAEALTPIPLNTVVMYHDRRYVVTAYDTPPPHLPDPEVNYPDGVAYVIWPEGMLRKFGNRAYSFVQVRRRSLTVIPGAAQERTE